MPLTWHTRKSRLGSLLNNGGDEEEEALALDRLLHGQSVIGKTCELHMCSIGGFITHWPMRHTAKTTEIDALRFTDRDLDVVGTLEYGQFGVVCTYIRPNLLVTHARFRLMSLHVILMGVSTYASRSKSGSP